MEPRTAAEIKLDKQAYFSKFKVLDQLENAVIALADTLPADPMLFLGNFFLPTSFNGISTSCQTISARRDKGWTIVTTVHFSFDGLKLEVINASLGNRVPIAEVDQDFAPYLTKLASSVRKGTS